MSIIIIFATVVFANLIWDIFAYINDIRKKNRREKNMSVMTVTLDEFMNEHGDFVKQIVYKVDGDFNGNIEGKNITVILMGDGNINGNINAKNGEIFINKGNVNGDVKADKVLMPNKKKDTYFGRRGIVVRCPHCDELYTQSLSINGYTSEDGANLALDVKIDVEEPFRHKCESCRYYRDSDISNKYYWCTEGGMARHCIKDGATICKYYEKK